MPRKWPIRGGKVGVLQAIDERLARFFPHNAAVPEDQFSCSNRFTKHDRMLFKWVGPICVGMVCFSHVVVVLRWSIQPNDSPSSFRIPIADEHHDFANGRITLRFD